MASRKDLAGLAALGALGYMLNRDKDTPYQGVVSQQDLGSQDAGFVAAPTGMANMGDSSNTTGEYAPGPSSMMRQPAATRPARPLSLIHI